MKSVSFRSIEFGGYWSERIELNRAFTIPAVFDRFKDTGRIDAFRCDWKEGDDFKPHIFWDSDVAKWIEGAAYSLEKHPDEKLEAKIDEIVGQIEKNQWDDGYFNIFYTVCREEKRFTDRMNHELYCAGHLMEAAVAYYYATGKDKLLRCMCRYADLIDRIFRVEGSADFLTPGHEEIELALVKLSECTGEEKYLNLSRWFVDTRGNNELDPKNEYLISQAYNQSHVPVREQFTAEGHSVRAVYLYSAMADLALHCNDSGLKNACEKLFENISQKRMYVTGGIGSSSYGEAFTTDYDLPNDVAYSESCAAIGLAFFARRMTMLDPDSRYADAEERAIYNGIMASTSLDGRSFFYEDPLEINLKAREITRNFYNKDAHFPITQRVEVFGCSCCPPNIVRFFASFGDSFYTYDDSAVYIHHYGANKAEFDSVKLEQVTDYPNAGTVNIKVNGLNGRLLALRIPAWSGEYKLLKNGKAVSGEMKKGYCFVEASDSDEITLELDMKPKFVYANAAVNNNVGRVAVTRGPIVYCLEGVDNTAPLNSLFVSESNGFTEKYDEKFHAFVLENEGETIKQGDGLYSLEAPSFEKSVLRFIPYYAFANRGETDMLVWVRKK